MNIENVIPKNKAVLLDLQLFAGELDLNEGEVSKVVDEPEEEEEQEELSEEEEESEVLRKRLGIIEAEKAIEHKRFSALEDELVGTKNTLNEMKELLVVLSSQIKAPKKQTKRTSNEDLSDIASKEMLISQMSKMEKSIQERDERDYIKDQLSKKPWVEEALSAQKILTQNEYIKNIMPMEEFLKEAYDLKKRSATREDVDILSKYGITSGVNNDAKANKKKLQAEAYGMSILDEVLK